MMSIPLEQYTLALALEDLLPVLFSAIGLFFIARIVARRDPSYASLARYGFLLVTFGGASKAIWKLLVATTGSGDVFYERALFGAMAPGFVFIAIAFLAATGVRWAAAPARMLGTLPSVVIFAVAFAGAQTGSRAVELVLLLVTIVGSTALSIQAIRTAKAQRLTVEAILFWFNLVASFALGGIGAQEQTIALQWSEQIINTFSQAAFAIAAFSLARVIAEPETVT